MAGFKITDNKGFCISFENGNTVSVQFGYGNYCWNYSNRELIKPERGAECHDAECAAWGANGEWHRLGDCDDVIGNQSPADVLALLNRMAGNPHAEEAPAMAEALRCVTDYLVSELGELADEDGTPDDKLGPWLGHEYAKQVIGARLRIRQARSILARIDGEA